MIVLPKNIQTDIRNNGMTVDSLAHYLITNYTVGHMATALAEFLIKPQTQPIIVTQEELDQVISLFRVKGINSEGMPETRGRKPKCD